jgi:hypothetical protein
MCGDERKDEGVVERLTRERDEARKDALVANRALRSVLLQDTVIEELEGKITVDQTQSIGQEFARLMFSMLQSVGAPNCLEWVVEHPSEGKFTLTLQRCRGKSPMELRNEAVDRAKHLENIIRTSCGWDGGLVGRDYFAAVSELTAKWRMESDANNQSGDPWPADGKASDDSAGQVGETPVRNEVPQLGGPGSPVRAGASQEAT